MGSIFQNDFRLHEFSVLTDALAIEFIQVIKESYADGSLILGNNITDVFYEKEAFFTISDSEFDNVLLHFKKKNIEMGYPYEIHVESRDSDSTSEFFIKPDQGLVNQLPKELLEELDEQLDKAIGIL